MGNVLYSLSDDTQVTELTFKVEVLEEYNQELKERIEQLESQVESLLSVSEPQNDESGIDFKSIDEFVEKFMKKNPMDIGKVKPLRQIPGLKNFEIDLMPSSVEKHLYSNIISLLLGFFDNEMQMNVANHRIHTIVSCLNKS
jgi:hypothetical protein